MDTAPVATQGIPLDGRHARPKKPFHASSGVGGHDLFVMGVSPRPGDHSSSVRFRRNCSSGRLCSILFVARELRHATLKPRRSICAGGSSPAPSERLRLDGEYWNKSFSERSLKSSGYCEANDGQSSVEGAKGRGRRVMHEFKHCELKTSRGRKLRNSKQAIAIGLREAGASKYESKAKNRENLKRTKVRERHGVTERDRSERSGGREATRSELYAEAEHRNIPGRSKMSKSALERALQ